MSNDEQSFVRNSDTSALSNLPAPASSLLPLAPASGSAMVTVSLSAAAQAKLQKATANTVWTPDSVLEQLIADHLHSAYPSITYRTVTIAEAGTFRAFDRKSLRPGLALLTSQGTYSIKVRPDNEDYLRFLKTYQDRGEDDPEGEAASMCLFKLQNYLEDCSADTRIIYPEDFLVQQFVQKSIVTT